LVEAEKLKGRKRLKTSRRKTQEKRKKIGQGLCPAKDPTSISSKMILSEMILSLFEVVKDWGLIVAQN